MALDLSHNFRSPFQLRVGAWKVVLDLEAKFYNQHTRNKKNDCGITITKVQRYIIMHASSKTLMYVFYCVLYLMFFIYLLPYDGL